MQYLSLGLLLELATFKFGVGVLENLRDSKLPLFNEKMKEKKSNFLKNDTKCVKKKRRKKLRQ